MAKRKRFEGWEPTGEGPWAGWQKEDGENPDLVVAVRPLRLEPRTEWHVELRNRATGGVIVKGRERGGGIRQYWRLEGAQEAAERFMAEAEMREFVSRARPRRGGAGS